MNRIITIALLFLSTVAFSQNYKLFNPTSRKVYAKLPEMDSTFNIKFDSVSYNGTDSVYHFYKDVGSDWIDGEGCPFWGSYECHPQDKPKWLGNRVFFNESHEYKFITLANDTLFLSFPLIQGGSVNFFEDETQMFSITYEGKDTTTILGILDTVQNYRINHFNPAGDTIESPLNNHMIIVGKTLGLIQFFQVDRFPVILKPLRLIGNISPNVGLYQITEAMAYDFQIGDEIQYHRYYFEQSDGQTYYYDNYYLKYMILDRTDSDNLITYQAVYETFDVDYSNYVYDTINLFYDKNLVLISIPFDKNNSNNVHYTRSLNKLPYCDLNLWTFRNSIDLELEYCESKNCWGYGDTFGPPPDDIEIYVLGLGLYSYYYFEWNPPYSSNGSGNYIVYFKKNGMSCGDEIFVGLEEQLASEMLFSISPNPSQNSLTITSEKDIDGTVAIYNLTGQELQKVRIDGQTLRIDISKLKAGIYLLRLVSGNNVVVKKIIKE